MNDAEFSSSSEPIAEMAKLVKAHCHLARMDVVRLCRELGFIAFDDSRCDADLLYPADCIAWIGGIAANDANLTRPELRLIFEKIRRTIPADQIIIKGGVRCIRLAAWREAVQLHADRIIRESCKTSGDDLSKSDDELDPEEISQRIERASMEKRRTNLD